MYLSGEGAAIFEGQKQEALLDQKAKMDATRELLEEENANLQYKVHVPVCVCMVCVCVVCVCVCVWCVCVHVCVCEHVFFFTDAYFQLASGNVQLEQIRTELGLAKVCASFCLCVLCCVCCACCAVCVCVCVCLHVYVITWYVCVVCVLYVCI